MADRYDADPSEAKPADPPPLLDPDFYAGDPYPVFARLRRASPLFWYEEGGFWVATKHADVIAISRDPQRFLSAPGLVLEDLRAGRAAPSSLLYMDPPQHRRLRKLVQTALTVNVVRALEDHARGIARRLLGEVEVGETVDFVKQVAAPLPVLVLAQLLGVPTADRLRFKTWVDALPAPTGAAPDENRREVRELLSYLAVAIYERAQRPTDDLLSMLLRARVDGGRLSEDEMLGVCLTLLAAGNETVRHLLSSGALALATHPEQRAALHADLTRVPFAVEEMLRWDGPILGFLRTASCDMPLANKKIRKGDAVWMLYASANRDESQFGRNAAEFVVTRNSNEHLAFGFGEHFCAGASLARLEARVLFEELLERFPNFSLAGDPIRRPSTCLRALDRLPLVFEPPRR